MKHDLSAWHSEVSRAFDAQTSLPDGMHALLAYCHKQHRWKGWQEIGKFDFEADVATMASWLNGVLKHEPPPASVKAFWFGIFNPIYDGETTCDTYIAGSNRFDPQDDSFEWACDSDYFPNDRYAHSQILHQLYRTLHGSPAEAMGEYILCLGYTAFVIRELATRVEETLRLDKSKKRGIAVGFDSGDGILLETLRQSAS